MKHNLNIKHIIEGRRLIQYDANKPPVLSEKIYQSISWTRYKMSKRELLEEARRESFDLKTVKFKVER